MNRRAFLRGLPTAPLLPAGSRAMTNFLIAATVVALILIGGAIHDHLSRVRHQSACERAGGVYVLGLTDFTCAMAQQVRK